MQASRLVSLAHGICPYFDIIPHPSLPSVVGIYTKLTPVIVDLVTALTAIKEQRIFGHRV